MLDYGLAFWKRHLALLWCPLVTLFVHAGAFLSFSSSTGCALESKERSSSASKSLTLLSACMEERDQVHSEAIAPSTLSMHFADLRSCDLSNIDWSFDSTSLFESMAAWESLQILQDEAERRVEEEQTGKFGEQVPLARLFPHVEEAYQEYQEAEETLVSTREDAKGLMDELRRQLSYLWIRSLRGSNLERAQLNKASFSYSPLGLGASENRKRYKSLLAFLVQHTTWFRLDNDPNENAYRQSQLAARLSFDLSFTNFQRTEAVRASFGRSNFYCSTISSSNFVESQLAGSNLSCVNNCATCTAKLSSGIVSSEIFADFDWQNDPSAQPPKDLLKVQEDMLCSKDVAIVGKGKSEVTPGNSFVDAKLNGVFASYARVCRSDFSNAELKSASFYHADSAVFYF